MTKSQVRNLVVCVILCVCVVTSVLPSIPGYVFTREQTEEAPQAPCQMRSENSVICGYVHDNATGNPLANVDVELDWENSQGNHGYNHTETDATGFYHFHTAAVDFGLYFHHENYFPKYSSWMTIGNNETCWYNVSLIPVPPQTVHFSGFITDNVSGEPIEGAEILAYWSDPQGNYWENTTWSNSSGYYYIGTLPGRNQIIVDHSNYFSYYIEVFTENNTLIWLNISLIPYPPISAVVCGYITDAELGIPLPEARVHLFCDTEYGQFYNYTSTDETGFYRIGTIPGMTIIMVMKPDYTWSWSQNFNVSENETWWMNLTMTFNPSETSIVKGYVVDSETRAAVRNAFVRLHWKDDVGHSYSKNTVTDQKGYYWVKAPKGTVRCLFSVTGYSTLQTAWRTLNDTTDLWVNASLSPEITLEFSKPQPGVYINNESMFPMLSKVLSRFFPKSKPLIIGPLEIVVNITKSTLGCNRVEFYIDGSYRGTDSEAPFTYYWDEKGLFTHEIRVVAYDNAGPCRIETVTVWKIR
jgi:5-hydroxyisourate hydrolase-like protein (transthyretin family)